MEREELIRLVTLAQSGDPEAMNTLFNAFYNDVYYFALKTVKDSELACDITQETFVAVITNLHLLQEPVAFVSWLKKIAYSQCTRYFRKKKEVLVEEDEEGGTVFDILAEDRTEFIPDAAMEQEDFRAAILDMIDSLSEEQRSAVMLYYYDELPVEQVAQIQGVSTGTVKSRLNYARKAIRRSVEDYEKKNGLKLHSFGLLPLILWLLAGSGRKAMPVAAARGVASGITAATGVTVSVGSSAGAVALGAAGGSAVGGAAMSASAAGSAAAGAGIFAKLMSVPAALWIVGGAGAVAMVVGGAGTAVEVVTQQPPALIQSVEQNDLNGNRQEADAVKPEDPSEEKSTKPTGGYDPYYPAPDWDPWSPESTDPVETAPTEPGETAPTAPGETAPTEPGEVPTAPTEPGSTNPPENTTPTQPGNTTPTTPTEPEEPTTQRPETPTTPPATEPPATEPEATETPTEPATEPEETRPQLERVPTGCTYTTADGEEYGSGEEIPRAPVEGDVLTSADYTYTFVSDYWSVVVKDNTRTSYGALLEKVNGVPLTNLNETFTQCVNMTRSPAIPSTVRYMERTFGECSELLEPPTLPDGLQTMVATFDRCTKLQYAPQIPTGVQDMSSAFSFCSALTVAPVLPSGVQELESTFQGCAITEAPAIPFGVTKLDATFGACSQLRSVPQIPASVKEMRSTFYDCTQLTDAPVLPEGLQYMVCTFEGCTALTVPPRIPSTVINMSYSFWRSGLKEAPTLPEGVEELVSAFADTNIKKAPVLPSSVKELSNAFENCSQLTKVPTIPEGVTRMYATFRNCTALSGTIVINAELPENYSYPYRYRYCFAGTTQPITLTGSCPYLQELADTATNGNVTVG